MFGEISLSKLRRKALHLHIRSSKAIFSFYQISIISVFIIIFVSLYIYINTSNPNNKLALSHVTNNDYPMERCPYISKQYPHLFSGKSVLCPSNKLFYGGHVWWFEDIEFKDFMFKQKGYISLKNNISYSLNMLFNHNNNDHNFIINKDLLSYTPQQANELHLAFQQTHCQTKRDEMIIMNTWNEIINKINFNWTHFEICFKGIKCLISSEQSDNANTALILDLDKRSEDILMELINKIEIEQERYLSKTLEFHRSEQQKYHLTIGVYNSKWFKSRSALKYINNIVSKWPCIQVPNAPMHGAVNQIIYPYIRLDNGKYKTRQVIMH